MNNINQSYKSIDKVNANYYIKQVYLEKKFAFQNTPTVLRYLTRKHQLAHTNLFELSNVLIDQILQDKVKLLLAQTIKYSVRAKAEIKIDNLLKIIRSTDDDSIRSEISFAIGYAIQNNEEVLTQNNLVSDILQAIREHVFSEAKSFLYSIINQTVGINNLKKNILEQENMQILKHHRKQQQKAVATKDQQQIKQNQANFISEEEEQFKQNISNALRNRKKIIKQNLHSERMPTIPDQDGNDRSFFSGTYKNVKKIYELVIKGSPLKVNDKDVYLVKKLIVGEKWFSDGILGEFIVDRMIVAIFLKISTRKINRQALTNDAMNNLIFFLNNSDEVLEELFKNNNINQLCNKFEIPTQRNQIEQSFFSKIELVKSKYGDNTIEFNSVIRQEIEQMREEVMEIFYHQMVISMQQFQQKQEYLNKIEKCLQDSNQKVKQTAFKILLAQDNNKDSKFEQMFMHCLQQMESETIYESKYENIEFINQQLKDSSRNKLLFSEDVVLRISVILKDQQQDEQTRLSCSEILNNYLDCALRVGLTDIQLQNCLTAIKENPYQTKLTTEILKTILLSANQKVSLPIEVVQFLIEKINEFDEVSINYIIITLGAICNNVQIHSLEGLSDKLLDNRIVVYRESEIVFEKPTQENCDCSSISSIVADIFYKSILLGTEISNKSLSSLTTTLGCGDKQTRILSAKALYSAFDNTYPNDLLLFDLIQYIEDRVADVAIYATMAYAKGVFFLSQQNITLKASHLEYLERIFVLDNLQLGEQDFTYELKNLILSTLKKVVYNQTFQPQLFRIFDLILFSNYNNEEIKFLKMAVSVLKIYTSRRLCIPQFTIKALENVFDFSKVHYEVLVTLENIIRNRQPVSEKILNIIADKFFLEEIPKARERAFQLLDSADENQDFPDDIFDKLELQRAGRVIQRQLPDVKEAIQFLSRKTYEGSRLPIDTLKSLINNIQDDLILSILSNVSKNNQMIPDDIADQLALNFNPLGTKTLLLDIFYRMILNNYKIPKIFCEKLEIALTNKSIFQDVLSIIAQIGQRREAVTFSVVDRLCRNFLKFEYQQIRPQLISTIVSLMETSEYGIKLINEVMKIGITDQNDAIENSSLEGLEILYKSKKLLFNSLDTLITKVLDIKTNFRCKKMLFQILKVQELDSLTHAKLLLSNFEPISSFQLLLGLKEFSKKYPFEQQSFQQIQTILDSEPDLQHQVIQLLQECTNKSEFPSCLVDSIARLSASTAIKSLTSSCYELMMLLAEAGCDFSSRSMEYIISQYDEGLAQSIIIKIAKNKEVSATARLLIRINDFKQQDTTQNLNLLLLDIYKEQLQGYQLPNSAIIKISLLFKFLLDTHTLNVPCRDVGAEIFAKILLTKPSYCSDQPLVFLIESAIISELPLNLSIVQGYATILASNNYYDVDGTIDCLAHRFQKEIISKELFTTIVECISAAAKITVLSKKGISILEYCLSIPDEKVRQSAYIGLMACQKNNQGSLPFEAWRQFIFSQLKEHSGKKQINPDPFLLETILSLKYIDVQKISKQPQNKWIRELLLSDLLSRIQASQEQQFDFYSNWQIVENCELYAGEKSLLVLKIICSKPLQFESVYSTIILLPKIDFETAINVLQNSLDYLTEIRLSYIQKLLRQYTNLRVRQNYLNEQASKIYRKIGFELTEKLLSCLGEIQSFSELTDLTDFIQANLQIDTSDFVVKKSSIRVLRRSLEVRLLENQFRSPLNKLGLAQIIDVLQNREDITFEIMMSLFRCLQRVSETETQFNLAEQTLIKVLQLQVDYMVPQSLFDQIVNVIENEPLNEWLRKARKISFDSRFNNVTKKCTIALIHELKDQNQVNKSIMEMIKDQKIQKLVEKIKNDQSISTIISEFWNKKFKIPFFSQKPIMIWSKIEILHWAIIVKLNKTIKNRPEFVDETLVVIRRACQLHMNQNMTDSQIISCILLLRADHSKGRLLQVATGEGKSLIVSVAAIYYGLGGRKVDIITSSPILAERDAKEKSKFFSNFKLSCADNGDKSTYLSGVKGCYEKDIVYGDASQFQFDWLRDHYSQLNTLAGRECEIAIVDEVDSMLIDDISKISRLSSVIAGMDQLQQIYHYIWQQFKQVKDNIFRIQGISYNFNGKIFSEKDELQIIDWNEMDNNQEFDIKQQIEAYAKKHLNEYITSLINNGDIKVPINLKELVNSQLSKWVDNVFVASHYQENEDYVVQEGVIKPVDYSSTGIIQNSTSWSNGLHQFLQIKHNLKMTSETFTTNFLSNMQFFKMYGVNLFGLTGTLGSTSTKGMIQAVYDVDVVIIPSIYNKQYIQLPTITTNSESQWLDQICQLAIEEALNMRGTLIICETIDHSILIANELKKQYRATAIKLYTMNNMNQEKQVEKIHPGEIIIATNLAGRGTDIKTDEIESYGGMQVLLTFMPPNQRVEDQAIGRTSRQGKKGTGRFILNGENLAGQVLILPQLVKQRDEIETKLMKEQYNNELKVIAKKDALFSKFCQLLCIVRRICIQKGRQDENVKQFLTHRLNNRVPTVKETSIVQSVEEQWIMFLRKIDDGSITIDDADAQFNSFEEQIKKDCFNDEIIKNPYYHIAIANDLIIQNQSSIKAMSHFDKSIKLDPQFSTAAYAGKAWLYLKDKQSFNDEKELQKGIKNMAIQELTKALSCLADERAVLDAIYSLNNLDCQNAQSELSKQLTQKISILGTYANSLQTNMNVIKRSQRLIDITCHDNRTQQLFQGVEVRDKVKIQEITKHQNKIYQVTFNDLTVKEDMFCKDQACETISKIFTDKKLLLLMRNDVLNSQKYKKVSINLKEICAEKISEFFNPHIEIKNVPQATAIAKLKNIFPYYERMFQQNKIEVIDSNITAQLISQYYLINVEILQNVEVKEVKKGLGPKEALEFIEQKRVGNPHYNVTFLNKNESYYKLSNDILPFSRVIVEVLELCQEDCKVLLQKININQLNVEIFGIKEEILQAIKTIVEDNVQTTILIFEVNKKSCFVFQPIAAEQYIQQDQRMQMYIQIQQLTIEVGKKVISQCHKCIFNLTFTSIDSVKEFEGLESRLLNVSFCEMNKQQAITLVPILRKENIQFCLEFSALSDDQLNWVISQASTKEEEINISCIKTLKDLFMDQQLPVAELLEFQAKGIEHLLCINEKKSIPYYNILAVLTLASIHFYIGAKIGLAGGLTTGLNFISEGISDVLTAYQAYRTGEFSWTQYCSDKSYSIISSAVCFGVNKMIITTKAVKILEQNAVKTVSNKVISMIFNSAKSKVKSTMLKQVALQSLEIVSGKNLNQLINIISNCSLEQQKTDIILQIKNQVSSVFCQPKLHLLISKMQALDNIASNQIFKNKIDYIVTDIINPQRGYMSKQWNSIGMQLYNNIFSNEKKIFNVIVSDISNIKEMSQIINNINYEIIKKLLQIEEETLQISQLLEKYLQIDQNKAVKITTILKENNILIINNMEIINNQADQLQNVERGQQQVENESPDFRIELINPLAVDIQENQYIRCEEPRILLNQVNFEENSDCQQSVIQFCTQLSNNMNKVEFSDLSELIISVSEAIAEKIIRILDGQLISSQSNQRVKALTTVVSNDIQNQLINESSDDQQMISENNQIINDRLRTEPTIQREKLLSLQSEIFCQQTQCNSIKLQAQRFVIAQKKQDILNSIFKAINPSSNIDISISKNVEQYAQQIRAGKPAELLEMQIMAANSGTNLKIVDDPYYQISSQDKTEGKQIVVFIKIKNDFQGYESFGHYKLLSVNKISISINQTNQIDSGYSIFEHFSGKSIQVLRDETANIIVSNCEEVSKALKVQTWIRERYLIETNSILWLEEKQEV